ncbi:uncharacterized protein LOC117181620 [Belonocnema kinseyi]|uniref:uncharacterized protein LOC117181620 n=1 Tax=Belonocnema kinseyi TaxID=2817044 RepID=UPI00143DD731|nr:uncharacterized protein LOC117181620 [Belonocnema kinseyi]
MVTKKIIKASNSPFNSPLWVVPQKRDASGKQKWRIVIDFRKLNEKTDQDAYSLPVIDEILDQLGKAKFFSAFDWSSGFHQIPMHEDSKKYTGFSKNEGHFHYNRLPMGLKNSPATFQRMMDTALRGLIGKICFAYLDDIVVFGSTLQEHNENLVILFERLRATGLKLQPDKCEFLRPELEYLGIVITENRVKPNLYKLSAVQNFKRPEKQKEVMSFLGLAGYYRKFIRNFSTIAKLLTELTKKNQLFNCTSTCETSFKSLKDALCSAPVLRYPDFKDTLTLTTDASNVGLGAILSQQGHPVCYISRTLNNPERNFTTTKEELLAIVWAVKRLRQYLLGHEFVIQTVHQALTWLFNKNRSDGTGTPTTGVDNELISERLRNHEPKDEKEIPNEYANWKKNRMPNKLKIKPVINGKNWIKISKQNIFSFLRIQLPEYNEAEWVKLLYTKIKDFTRNKSWSIFEFHMEGPLSNITERIRIGDMLNFLLQNKFAEYTFFLCERPDKQLNVEEKQNLLREAHGNVATGHFGEKLTRIRPKVEAVIPEMPTQPNDKIAMDIVGPLPETTCGNKYILSIQDVLTKYIILVAISETTSVSIQTNLLDHYIYIFSSPKHILTDQDANFVSELVNKFENLFRIMHVKTTAFHPQSNGALERTYGTIKDFLKTYMADNETEWDQNLNLICLAFNTAVHESTGLTPLEITFGRKANLPSALTTTTSITHQKC